MTRPAPRPQPEKPGKPPRPPEFVFDLARVLARMMAAEDDAREHGEEATPPAG